MEGPEPTAGVIEDTVEDDPHPTGMDGVHELSQGRIPAEERVDREVVIRVVSVVRR